MSACLYCAEEEETANSRNAADDEIIEGYVLGFVVGHTAGVSLVGREEEEEEEVAAIIDDVGGGGGKVQTEVPSPCCAFICRNAHKRSMTPRVHLVGDCVWLVCGRSGRRRRMANAVCTFSTKRERFPIIMFVLGSFLKSRKMVFGWRRTREEEVTTKETTVGVLTPFPWFDPLCSVYSSTSPLVFFFLYQLLSAGHNLSL